MALPERRSDTYLIFIFIKICNWTSLWEGPFYFHELLCVLPGICPTSISPHTNDAHVIIYIYILRFKRQLHLICNLYSIKFQYCRQWIHWILKIVVIKGTYRWIAQKLIKIYDQIYHFYFLVTALPVTYNTFRNILKWIQKINSRHTEMSRNRT